MKMTAYPALRKYSAEVAPRVPEEACVQTEQSESKRTKLTCAEIVEETHTRRSKHIVSFWWGGTKHLGCSHIELQRNGCPATLQSRRVNGSWDIATVIHSDQDDSPSAVQLSVNECSDCGYIVL
jgi:hypothetical protein